MSKSKDGVSDETTAIVVKITAELKSKVVELNKRYDMSLITIALGITTMRVLAATTIAHGFPVEESYETFVETGLRDTYDMVVEEIQEGMVKAIMSKGKI